MHGARDYTKLLPAGRRSPDRSALWWSELPFALDTLKGGRGSVTSVVRPGASVTEVALACGIEHLGRFGESPRETLLA